MSERQMLGYHPNSTWIHRLDDTNKLVFLIVISVACATTYDTCYLLGMSVVSLVLLRLSNIKWLQISSVIKFIAIFSLLNILTVYLFTPEYGVDLYQPRTVIWEGIGRFTLTQKELFCEFSLVLKYFCTTPLALIFLLTTNPSELASSLNRIGVSHRISYAVALVIRYTPDIQENFFNISLA